MFPDSFFLLIVTVCRAVSLFLKTTSVPARTVRSLGLNFRSSWSISGFGLGVRSAAEALLPPLSPPQALASAAPPKASNARARLAASARPGRGRRIASIVRRAARRASGMADTPIGRDYRDRQRGTGGA